ncbi:hypothetical protein A3F65_01995 [Candidatus Saccharibacteria bacterium RIFCSPHIGHO2_12_FULL_47_16b]|nr:MAG: hypothetical protein A3F65_01995 [Candidatus Saccharibacteria bacterium RIFCSPHIGHO2_12_FULL_47_16b]
MRIKRLSLLLLAQVFAVTILLGGLFPVFVDAAAITNRKLTLSTSSAAAGAATTTYTFDFTVPSATVLQSFEVVICTTVACGATPTGFSNSSSTLSSQPVNLGDASGWTVNTATAGKLRIKKTGNVAAPTGSQTVVFGNVQNPTTANQTFFGKINTYSDDAWTTLVDSGIVAASTATQISLTGVMNETLVFCVGTSITDQDCGTIAGNSIDFGSFSTTATKFDDSVMAASTNGAYGYSITVNGATLTCTTCNGTKTISALASQTASSTGSEQFGINLKNNATPDIGAEVTGTGTATATANYGTVDQYRFVTADSVASVAGSTNANTFTASYIVNVAGTTEAGTYTATMTYIATATF